MINPPANLPAYPSYLEQSDAVRSRFDRLKQRDVILNVRNLYRRFDSPQGEGLDVEALRDVSFKVHRREFICVIGPSGCGKRDLAPNINFFMNVPVTAEGGLTFADGVSAPGKYVELRADMDVWLLVSNCPQLNNPCNAYHPTPAQFLLWNPG